FRRFKSCLEFSHFGPKSKCCIATSVNCSDLSHQIKHLREIIWPRSTGAVKPGLDLSRGSKVSMVDVVAAVVVAAGRGVRAGGELPKQYRTLSGVPVIRKSLAMFADHTEVSLVQPVIHRDDAELCATASTGMRLLAPVFGGKTRQESVHAG